MGRPDAEHPPAPRQPSPAELEHAAGVLQLLADRTRLGILALLASGGELSVGEIAEHLERPVPAVSQHLAKLKGGTLVLTRREGTSIHYRLGGEHVAELVENLLQHTEHALFADPPHHTAVNRGVSAENPVAQPEVSARR
ncbi:hypothetical protein GCM10009847_06120 [Leucobacter tardus]|uniref:Helix-turn-helix transcriptional regulator n=1 Tax=Leucobacter tardus TaxID=501483 RepID=A0A939TTL1_9MICO|nr:metalloregulator ArsR/SmtB family transcription factor [Leucobacter tardus]MBO2988815.1 helix-turn-helix transcriptional regulator [Leucobacter tardus]